MSIFISAEKQQKLAKPGTIAALVGGVLMLAAPFLPWAYSRKALDNMTVYGYPSPLQMMLIVLAILVLVGVALNRKLLGQGRWVNGVRGAKPAALMGLIYVAILIGGIAFQLGGLINVEPGGWIALVGALVATVGTAMLPDGPDPRAERAKTPSWLGIAAIALVMAFCLFAAAFGLNQDDGSGFVAFIIFVGGVALALVKSGVFGWLKSSTGRSKRVLVLAAFVVAFAFPFTQGGSDANMSIASQVLIFAATALGLNIVVGLAGLLDLGYIAFLGAGAFTAAVLSKSAFSTLDWHPPFIVVVLISGIVSSLLGLIIGSPTLRVSGDYLAIVTLAFGEIFRLSMLNLDGSDGPDLTHGSNGIPGIPDLKIGAFNFKETHEIFGVEIGRFSNYYWLMLLLLALIIVVFSNLNKSRIGRGWVAIREDEKAAEAMGVNVFGLKLLAFAGGAFLAGLAGSIKAHQDVSVTPDQYIFLESAFLLAAVVLGGMGTIVGVLVGATMLKLLPEKLRFLDNWRLLIFGLLLVVMMRFRPEGLIADERRQLEFHDDDEELAEQLEEEVAAK